MTQSLFKLKSEANLRCKCTRTLKGKFQLNEELDTGPSGGPVEREIQMIVGFLLLGQKWKLKLNFPPTLPLLSPLSILLNVEV